MEDAQRDRGDGRPEWTGRQPVHEHEGAWRQLAGMPSSLEGARVETGAPVLRRAAVVAVLVVLVLVAWTWWTDRQSAPHDVAASSSAPSEEEGEGLGVPSASGAASGEPPSAVAPSAGAAAATPSGGATDPGPVTVHVVGAVERPGVVELPAGSRVGEAVDEAGGLTDEADPTRLNLARELVDGEQLYVLREGEEPPEPVAGGGPAVEPPGGAAAGGGPGGVPGAASGGGSGESAGAGGATGVVDLNSADQAALEELPGVGPVTAQDILAWRTQNGRFTSVDELMEVPGIGEKTLETLRPHVSVG